MGYAIGIHHLSVRIESLIAVSIPWSQISVSHFSSASAKDTEIVAFDPPEFSWALTATQNVPLAERCQTVQKTQKTIHSSIGKLWQKPLVK